MTMNWAMFLAAVGGLVALYLMLPKHAITLPRTGGLVGAVVLGAVLLSLLPEAGAGVRAPIYFYIFTFIAIFAALAVICHPRPIYSALYFVMVVLAVAAMFLTLEAEFMAIAMIAIYAGAILVTYCFVIMLATLPATGHDEQEATPIYDRHAREPFVSALLGIVLIVLLSNIILTSAPPTVGRPERTDLMALTVMPGEVEQVLRELGAIGPDADVDRVIVQSAATTPDTANQVVAILEDDEAAPGDGQILVSSEAMALLDERVGNIERVGLNLFEKHTLGIELAGIILLMSMVGAVVIARIRIPGEDGEPADDDRAAVQAQAGGGL